MHDVYRGKDSIKKFCEYLRDNATKMINFKKKNIQVIKLTNSRNHIKSQNIVIFVKKSLKKNLLKIKNIVRLGTIVIVQGNIEILHIAYVL